MGYCSDPSLSYLLLPLFIMLVLGSSHSAETLAKISGENNHFFFCELRRKKKKTHSPATRAKMSAANKGEIILCLKNQDPQKLVYQLQKLQLLMFKLIIKLILILGQLRRP
jgi:hypothetical protein